MISRDDLAIFLDEYLACASFNDYAPNGIQVAGRPLINTICTAVTASQSVIEQAQSLQADALLVHHGYFWRGEDAVITGMKRKRVGMLINNDISLLAYHLPLDCHLELGNNACIGKLLKVKEITMHRAGKTPNLLWMGTQAPITPSMTSHYLEEIFHRKPLHIQGGPSKISRIAWCSGGAQDFIEDAARLGADAYISGEVSERTYYQAQELGIHYFACGHHATERFGIQALGELISIRFNLTHSFLDTDNPI